MLYVDVAGNLYLLPSGIDTVVDSTHLIYSVEVYMSRSGKEVAPTVTFITPQIHDEFVSYDWSLNIINGVLTFITTIIQT